MFDKITARINKLAYELDQRYIDTAAIAQKVRRTGAGDVGGGENRRRAHGRPARGVLRACDAGVVSPVFRWWPACTRA